jgi:uracil-DNA glycosylase family 4
MKFDTMTAELNACRLCRKNFGFEPRPVFFGNQNSKIMQISQSPSQNVHKTGKSFDDASGRKLRSEWYMIPDKDFYNDNNFYISGIGHCYPGKDKNGGDRAPPKRCADKWLKLEIELVNNKMFVLVGRHSAEYFFPKKSFKELVFTDQKINGKPTIVLPHPSPLNKKWLKDNPNFEKKRLPEIRKKMHQVLYEK